MHHGDAGSSMPFLDRCLLAGHCRALPKLVVVRLRSFLLPTISTIWLVEAGAHLLYTFYVEWPGHPLAGLFLQQSRNVSKARWLGNGQHLCTRLLESGAIAKQESKS